MVTDDYRGLPKGSVRPVPEKTCPPLPQREQRKRHPSPTPLLLWCILLPRRFSTLFKAYGTIMKEYVAVPDALLKNTKELQKYLELSYEYVKTLKPKPSKRKS
jgi:hypothetical protein